MSEDLTDKGKEIVRREITLFTRRDENYSTNSTTSPISSQESYRGSALSDGILLAIGKSKEMVRPWLWQA